VLVVSNSSPLIALKAIERISLLPNLFESILIPTAIVLETSRSIPVKPAWLRIEAPARPLPKSVLRTTLGPGEREAIALALERRADLMILDELPARKIARTTGVNVVGTVGILLASKRRGFISLLRPELDKLLQNSFFLSPQLYRQLLQVAGEIDH